MPRIEILCIGNELLIGKTVNTNAAWLSEEIHRMGCTVSRHTVVGDDVESIAEAVKEALKRHTDILIVCGGLGPTYDDKTLEGVARALRRRLEVSREALTQIEAKYLKLVEQRILSRFDLTPARVKMATLPSKSTPLRNPVGTAPAVTLEYRGSRIFCLPGVPSELMAIFAESVAPFVKKMVGELFVAERWLEVRGLPESSLAPILDGVVARYGGVYVKSHPYGFEGSEPRLRIYVSATKSSRAEAESLVEAVSSELTSYICEAGGRVVRK